MSLIIVGPIAWTNELLSTFTDWGISERSTAMRVELSADLPTKLVSFSDLTSKAGNSTAGPDTVESSEGAAATWACPRTETAQAVTNNKHQRSLVCILGFWVG